MSGITRQQLTDHPVNLPRHPVLAQKLPYGLPVLLRAGCRHLFGAEGRIGFQCLTCDMERLCSISVFWRASVASDSVRSIILNGAVKTIAWTRVVCPFYAARGTNPMGEPETECAQCGGKLCGNDTKTCVICGDTICKNRVNPCPSCHREVCTGCMDDEDREKCGDCVDRPVAYYE